MQEGSGGGSSGDSSGGASSGGGSSGGGLFRPPVMVDPDQLLEELMVFEAMRLSLAVSDSAGSAAQGSSGGARRPTASPPGPGGSGGRPMQGSHALHSAPVFRDKDAPRGAVPSAKPDYGASIVSYEDI